MADAAVRVTADTTDFIQKMEYMEQSFKRVSVASLGSEKQLQKQAAQYLRNGEAAESLFRSERVLERNLHGLAVGLSNAQSPVQALEMGFLRMSRVLTGEAAPAFGSGAIALFGFYELASKTKEKFDELSAITAKTAKIDADASLSVGELSKNYAEVTKNIEEYGDKVGSGFFDKIKLGFKAISSGLGAEGLGESLGRDQAQQVKRQQELKEAAQDRMAATRGALEVELSGGTLGSELAKNKIKYEQQLAADKKITGGILAEEIEQEHELSDQLIKQAAIRKEIQAQRAYNNLLLREQEINKSEGPSGDIEAKEHEIDILERQRDLTDDDNEKLSIGLDIEEKRKEIAKDRLDISELANEADTEFYGSIAKGLENQEKLNQLKAKGAILDLSPKDKAGSKGRSLEASEALREFQNTSTPIEKAEKANQLRSARNDLQESLSRNTGIALGGVSSLAKIGGGGGIGQGSIDQKQLDEQKKASELLKSIDDSLKKFSKDGATAQ